MNQEYKNMIHSVVVLASLSPEEQNKRYQPFLDFLKVETPEKLYRFRLCSERAIDEFDQNKLGFAPAYKMNDEFDGLLYFDKAKIKAALVDALTPQKVVGLVELLRQGAIPEEIRNCIPAEILQLFLNSFSRYTPEMIESLINQFLDFTTNDYDKRMSSLSELTRSLKIASLSTEINSPAMWGYYANNGTGFALSYDLRESDFAEYCPVPVIYGNERFDATQYATWLFQQQIMKSILASANATCLYSTLHSMIPCPDHFMPAKILIHKATDWGSEKEWRLVYYKRNNLENAEFPYIIRQPTGIYLGRNISSIHEKVLRHIAAEKGIPAYNLYRYVSFESFVGMIQQRSLTFVLPELWIDPKESAPFQHLAESCNNLFEQLMLYAIHLKTYCQC